MTDRQEIETKVAGLQEMLQKIQGELSAKEAGLKNLGEDRLKVMTAALERGKRANTDKLTVEIAQLEAQVDALRLEREIGQNLLSHAQQELQPFRKREQLAQLCRSWEGLVYDCQALAGKRLDWGVRRRACALALERDNVGLQALLLVGIGGERDLRRHTDRTDYNDLTWPELPLGLYPEVLVLGRSLAAEMGKEGVVATKIPPVPANEIARALDQSHGDRQNRLTRYKRFQDDYAPEPGPDDVAEEKWAGIKLSFE